MNTQFRKKPVVIEAFQLPASGQDVPDEFHAWCERVGFIDFESDRDEGLAITTLEGVMRADPGDWIIKGVKGEFYPCKPDIFAATYEPADQMPSAALEQPADKTSASAFERAMKDSWGMVDPLDPPGTPGSYARGEHNGIVAALRTVRMNYERHAAPAAQQQEGGTHG